MRKSNKEYFYNKYPQIYEKNPNIACGDGWFGVLDDISTYIAKHYPDIRISSVIEKYGGIRVILSTETADLRQYLVKATRKSFQICESCGNDGKVVKLKEGQLKTICKTCRGTLEKREYPKIIKTSYNKS